MVYEEGLQESTLIPIPLKKCENEYLSYLDKELVYSGQFHCPDFDDSHYLYQDWFENEFAYY